MKFRGCLQVIVKFLNLLLFVIGVCIILYSVWMLKEFKHEGDGNENGLNSAAGRPFILLVKNTAPLRDDFAVPVPWFIYSFMGIGIFVCIVSFCGYVAAEAASGCCLCCYSVFMGIFLVLQAALAATIFFDRKWEKDFPKDATGQIHKIRNFVDKNSEFCKWIALAVVVLEALSLLFGMILRAVVGDFRRSGYDSDDDYVAPPRRQASQGGPSSPPELRSTWSTKLRDKYSGDLSYPSESRRLLQQNSAPEESRSRCSIM